MYHWLISLSVLSYRLKLTGTVLQIRRGKRDNFPILLSQNIYCDPSLEPCCRGGSNVGSQHMFSVRNKKSYL